MSQMSLYEPFDDQTKAPDGNKMLVKYGIQNEGSHYRAHVCYPTQRVYVFSTAKARAALERAKFAGLKPRPVHTNGIQTAEGYPIPLSYLDDLQEIIIPQEIWNKFHIDKTHSTSMKGTLAAAIVYDLLKRHLINLPIMLDLTDSHALQVSGTDILINGAIKLQVKCDMPGGDRKHGGSGNLFLQTAECNPYKRY